MRLGSSGQSVCFQCRLQALHTCFSLGLGEYSGEPMWLLLVALAAKLGCGRAFGLTSGFAQHRLMLIFHWVFPLQVSSYCRMQDYFKLKAHLEPVFFFRKQLSVIKYLSALNRALTWRRSPPPYSSYVNRLRTAAKFAIPISSSILDVFLFPVRFTSGICG